MFCHTNTHFIIHISKLKLVCILSDFTPLDTKYLHLVVPDAVPFSSTNTLHKLSCSLTTHFLWCHQNIHLHQHFRSTYKFLWCHQNTHLHQHFRSTYTFRMMPPKHVFTPTFLIYLHIVMMPPKHPFTPTCMIYLHISLDATKTLIYTNISDLLTHCYDATKTPIYTNMYDLLTHFSWCHQNTHLHQHFSSSTVTTLLLSLRATHERKSKANEWH